MSPRRTPEEMQALVDSVEALAQEKNISKADACRELGMQTSTYYNTKQKCPGTKKVKKNTSIVMQKVPIAETAPRFVPRNAERVIIVACEPHTLRELLSL